MPAASTNGHSRRPSQAAAESTAVTVVVRIRPGSALVAAPARFQRVVVQALSPTTIQIEAPSSPRFTFDRVIAEDEGQEAVYGQVSLLVDVFVAGMNCTILAYGQTSSGKSWTMGTDRPSDVEEGPERRGITPRSIAAIFECLAERERESGGTSTFVVKASYVEIYNEELIDLLDPDTPHPNIQIREDKDGTIIWSGLTEVFVTNFAEVMRHLTAGSALRQTGATSMNAQSSRSHAIFSLTLVQRRYTGTGTPTSVPASPRNSRISLAHSPLPGSPRSMTPNGDQPGSRSSLRPGSVLGLPSRGTSPFENGAGVDSWSTLTSKFHFVDLAGSERLKRTAAAGERVKEGISINSGLHALGNCISALGDPKRVTHVPYRDSRLTRLLQDSLGGNARTLMIACISPTEANVNETLSTLKYANRAKNIQNHVSANETEVGWDDLEYLRQTVTKLRASANLAQSSSAMGAIPEESRPTRELTDRYSDLTLKYAELAADHAQAQAAAASSPSLSSQSFSVALEPIVEEYEKSLSALESQLSLTKAALGHSEEEMRDLELRLEEEEIANETGEATIDELRSRLAKIIERDATTETYVHDLEGKLKDFGEQDEHRGVAVSDLRRQITSSREHAETTEKWVQDLERRLAVSDEVNATLGHQVGVLERDVARRQQAYRELEGRTSLLDTSDEHKELLSELEERGRRLLDLERDLDDLRARHLVAEQGTGQLQAMVAAEQDEKAELQTRIRSLERASLAVLSRSNLVVEDGHAAAVLGGDVATTPVTSVDAQLAELQARLVTTQSELHSVQALHLAALKAIETLTVQLDEARLVILEDGDHLASPTAKSFPGKVVRAESLEDLSTPRTPPQSSANSPSPRARRSLQLSPQPRLSFLGRGAPVSPSTSHGRSASLSQEQPSAFGVQTSSTPGAPGMSLAGRTSREFSPGIRERSYEQLRTEVMKLQAALIEREEEIAILESRSRLRAASVTSLRSLSLPEGTTDVNEMASPRRQDSFTNGYLLDGADASPEMLSDSLILLPEDPEEATRLDDLMRSMAKMESSHRETIEELQGSILGLQRDHADLTRALRDQIVSLSAESSRLTDRSASVELAHDEALRTQGEEHQLARGALLARNDAVLAQRDAAAHKHSAALSALSQDHATNIDQRSLEHSSTLAMMDRQHQADLAGLEESHQATLLALETEHADTIAQIHADRHASLTELSTRHEQTIAGLTAHHETILAGVREELSALAGRPDSLAVSIDGSIGSRDRSVTPERTTHSSKAPPPTPPPSMPMPLPPASFVPNRSVTRAGSVSSLNLRVVTPDLPDPSLRRLEEQETMARLIKQLAHCESDLTANVDLVSTLELALNDSERNLRKARTTMASLTVERDAISHQNETYRAQLQDAHEEVEAVRNSVTEVEGRLQAERQGKERARLELERRLDEAKRKKSKFSCI